jgi:Domain of unknown function (DUF4167)
VTKSGNRRIQIGLATNQTSRPSRTHFRSAQASTINWQRSLDHHLDRARHFINTGETIEAENCYQHAEHYVRMIGAATGSLQAAVTK